jgi:hypothetical protein
MVKSPVISNAAACSNRVLVIKSWAVWLVSALEFAVQLPPAHF